jgi:hypothetical protein
MKRHAMRIAPVLFLTAAVLAVAPRVAVAGHAEGWFERSLKVTGAVDLMVTTGSGDIVVRPGDSGAVRVTGKIRVSDWKIGRAAAEDKVARLEDHPPIEQDGNSIRVGRISNPELRRGVSISYEVVVPAETRANAETGSGNASVSGVSGPVRVNTGSGNVRISNVTSTVRASTGSGDIELTDLGGQVYGETGSGNLRALRVNGPLTATTGSGDVRVEQSSDSTVKVETGSGNIEVTAGRGSMLLHTGSGNITARGEPSGEWRLDTGSGNIRAYVPENAAFDLDCHTGSGGIVTKHPLTVEGKISRHAVRGKVRGGGARLMASTGSGNIEIQ